MAAIPVPIEEDNEDVAWALQTADALWKRNERVDAIVWLRRAAQAAGDAQNDDRALSLAREAAELAEWIARNPVPGRVSRPPPGPTQTPINAEVVDELLRRVQSDDEVTLPDLSVEAVPYPARSRPSLGEALRNLADSSTDEVRTAAEAHAGMLDPWAQAERVTSDVSVVELDSSEAEDLEEDEIVTSAPAIEGDALDLSEVDAFADLPDDVRETFARRAKIHDLERGDEVSDFALALVLRGAVDVVAMRLDAAATRLDSGSVLRSRGTIEKVTPVRLVAGAETVRVATWSETDVASAFGACPWVEEEICTLSDRVHALVGVTLGRLGDRLDPVLRAEITSKLDLRVMRAGEIFMRAGEPIPGFMIVGAGALERLAQNGQPHGAALPAGTLLFPSQVLSAAAAPETVRAGDSGALVLLSNRHVAQELLVTCPPLIEMLAEGA
jgi:hypothetical protein